MLTPLGSLFVCSTTASSMRQKTEPKQDRSFGPITKTNNKFSIFEFQDPVFSRQIHSLHLRGKTQLLVTEYLFAGKTTVLQSSVHRHETKIRQSFVENAVNLSGIHFIAIDPN